MMDREEAYLIPEKEMTKLKQYLSTTTKNGKTYWHVILYEKDGAIYLWLAKKHEKLSIENYKV